MLTFLSPRSGLSRSEMSNWSPSQPNMRSAKASVAGPQLFQSCFSHAGAGSDTCCGIGLGVGAGVADT